MVLRLYLRIPGLNHQPGTFIITVIPIILTKQGDTIMEITAKKLESKNPTLPPFIYPVVILAAMAISNFVS
jgi:hypothetical protein